MYLKIKYLIMIAH